MKLWIGITDKAWFQHLARFGADEVNFWQPGGSKEFRVLQAGEPFLFKLHSPDNFIVGGGFFVRYSTLPASLAWDAFQQKNGVASLADLLARIRKYRKGEPAVDPVIGCNVLTEPFFLERGDWVPAPASWSPHIVQGKTYDTEQEEGRRLWEQVTRAAMSSSHTGLDRGEPFEIGQQLFGAEYLARSRLGQGAFRVLVTDAYRRRCAVTGETTLPVLEAAHIRPYSAEGPHRVSNGLLLRADLHKLFDIGYVTVTLELRVEVSRRLREEWENGREYYAYHGKPLAFRPADLSRSAPEFLAWHNENRFMA